MVFRLNGSGLFHSVTIRSVLNRADFRVTRNRQLKREMLTMSFQKGGKGTKTASPLICVQARKSTNFFLSRALTVCSRFLFLRTLPDLVSIDSRLTLYVFKI
jgi:hypothetical protein